MDTSHRANFERYYSGPRRRRPVVSMVARAVALGLALLTAIAAVAPLAAADDPNDKLIFDVRLEGAAERPNPVDTQAHGRVHIEVKLRDGAIESLKFLLLACNIQEATVAHIHASAGPDATAPPVLFLLHAGDPQSATGCIRLSGERLSGSDVDEMLINMDAAGFLAALESGNAYVNVHTKAHPGGEIRGQLV